MSRYIDFYLIGELVDSHGNVHYEDLKHLPTADVIEVIRCKDCKHQRFYSKDNESFYCKELVTIEMHMSDGDGEFYCSYGERKTDDKG